MSVIYVTPYIKNAAGAPYTDYNTRKLCYRKDDRAMPPTYGCPENFRDSLTTSTATIPNIFMSFCSGRPMNVSTKFEVRSFTRC